ncbi:MAG: heme-binding protein [Pseudonocardiaceae bacterium]
MTEKSVASTGAAISSVRLAMDNTAILNKLGLLQELAGTWQGTGFNLIARPDFKDQADLYLQLNQTRETLKFELINAPIPNRGFGQPDIDLFGLTYLQQISDAFNGGLLHVEPGLWITQPSTTYPPESAPPGARIVGRLGTIPHGSSLLAQGTARPFSGPPTLKTPTTEYAFSEFPSFNSTSFGINLSPPDPAVPPIIPIIHAAGTSEKLSTTAPPEFKEYDLTVRESKTNPRSPFETNPPELPLPAAINGVPMQDVVNDPIKLLQAAINKQVAAGYTFEGVALNIATQSEITFFRKANSKNPNDPKVVVKPVNGAGGIENILFLEGGEPVGKIGPNANTSLVYATFWIEKVSHRIFPPFMQLQYAQMVILDFQVRTLLLQSPPTNVNVGWPHISVATLTKSFI